MPETGGSTLCIRSLGFSRGCFNRLMGHVYKYVLEPTFLPSFSSVFNTNPAKFSLKFLETNTG